MTSTTGAHLEPPSSDQPSPAAGDDVVETRAESQRARKKSAASVDRPTPTKDAVVESLASADLDEQRYRRLIANSPVGQATYGLKGRMIEVNPAWAELL